jgi:hypothetical protein
VDDEDHGTRQIALIDRLAHDPVDAIEAAPVKGAIRPG